MVTIFNFTDWGDGEGFCLDLRQLTFTKGSHTLLNPLFTADERAANPPHTHIHSCPFVALQRSRLQDQRRKMQQWRKQWRRRGWEKKKLGWLSLCSNLYVTYLVIWFYFASTASKFRGLRKWRGKMISLLHLVLDFEMASVLTILTS